MLTRPLFLGTTLGLPLLLVLQMSLLAAATSRGSRGPGTDGPAPSSRATSAPEGVFGYVDPTGFVRTIPDDLAPGSLRSFADEASAVRALASGEVVAVSLVPADYADTGTLVVLRPDASPLSRRRAAGPMPDVLLLNTVGGDAGLARRIRAPIAWNERPLEPAPAAAAERPRAEADSSADEVFGLLSMLLLYAVVLLSSGLLLRSVSDEKKNRTMELLLVCLDPRQLLAGKVIGLGLVGLVQAAAWAACFIGAVALAGEATALPPGLAAGPAVIGWGALLFLFGYAVYAGLTASAGALVPDATEARGAGFVLVSPALVGFVLAELQLGNPHGPLMTGLSLFPLTAPFVMMVRLSAGGVPTWQLVLALALMGATAVVIVRLAARMFRAQHLLSGERFTFARYAAALLGRRSSPRPGAR